MKTLILKDIVHGTSTNSEAYVLYLEMQNVVEDKNQSITLSFSEIAYVSSSFLNSSLGEFIDKFGFDFFAKRIKFTDCKPELAKQIKDYVVKYKSLERRK